MAGGGGTPYNGVYEEAPPERGTFFRLQVYKKGRDFRVLIEVYEVNETLNLTWLVRNLLSPIRSK